MRPTITLWQSFCARLTAGAWPRVGVGAEGPRPAHKLKGPQPSSSIPLHIFPHSPIRPHNIPLAPFLSLFAHTHSPLPTDMSTRRSQRRMSFNDPTSLSTSLLSPPSSSSPPSPSLLRERGPGAFSNRNAPSLVSRNARYWDLRSTQPSSRTSRPDTPQRPPPCPRHFQARYACGTYLPDRRE